MQTDDVEGFLRSAEENVGHYGRGGLLAFEAAHHNNVLAEREPETWYPWCFRRWDGYNVALALAGRLPR